MEQEQTSLDLEREVIRKEVEDEMQQSTQIRLENEFIHQVELLKQTFQEERQQLEDRIQALQDELAESADQERAGAEQRNKDMEHKLRMAQDAETRSQRQIKELKETNSALRAEKQKLEDDKSNLRKELEDKIHELTIEREEAVTAAHANRGLQGPLPNGDHNNAAILREIDAQKRLLVDKTGTLQRQLENLERNQKRSAPLQMSHDRLLNEKEGLENDLQDMDDRVKGLMDQSIAAEQYKAQAQNREAERDALRQQLEMTTDRLTDASTALTLANSQHQRELQSLRQKMADSVDMEKYNKLNSQCLEAQRKVSELEAALEKRTAEMTKALMGTQSDHQRSVQRLEMEKEESDRRAEQLQGLLDEQVSGIKDQLEQSSKRDLLVKDLYVENAQLIKSLQVTEKREKDAEKKVYGLEEKCRSYQRLIQRLTPLAIG